MKRVLEVSDFEMQRTREFMLLDGWSNPSEDEVFDMALAIRERMEDCCMSATDAFIDIMH